MQVVMIGPFPPPTHGMSLINERMHQLLMEEGADVERVDTAAPSLERGVIERMRRLVKVPRALAKLCSSRADSVYISVSGGLGQVYEILYVIAARIRSANIYLHHHCYSYIDHKTLLIRVLIACSGRRALHIALSEGMADSLAQLGVRRVLALSNSAFYPDANEVDPGRAVETVGFLGNISKEKGIFEFLDLAEEFGCSGCKTMFLMAGPFQDSDVAADVTRRMSQLRNVQYLGPVYGDDKAAFFDRIDVLLFPTKYRNEAEPLTVHEALRVGKPVIAWARGAIGEMLENSGGLAIPRTTRFVGAAASKLNEWMEHGDTYEEASRRSVRCFRARRADALEQLDSLYAMLRNGKRSGGGV